MEELEMESKIDKVKTKVYYLQMPPLFFYTIFIPRSNTKLPWGLKMQKLNIKKFIIM